MKNKIIYILFALFFVGSTFTSCTDYLDRDSESVLSEADAFKDFKNFQGFIEVMYNVIPDVAKHNWVSSFNWGDDEVITTGNGENLMGYAIDGGNYRTYLGKENCFLDRTWAVDQRNPPGSGPRFDKALWGGGWYAIRQANIGLEALQKGMLKDATQEERDFIEGQLYFFRAWFYFQLTTYWGGLPYMTSVLAPDPEQFNLPRESYQENAEKMAADFQRAADLLPIDWDKTVVGTVTSTNNAFRPNKIWALSYLGKCLLYAGSPLMENGGENNNRSYNAEYCKRAADALGKVLALVESGQTQYKLEEFDKYSTLFYTKEQGWLMPGGKEAIMRSPTYGADSYWRQMNSYQLSVICEGDGIILCPAANYVNYFGMKNGLPLNDLNSKFEKSQPWKDRDPRFYNNFIYDGVKMIKNPAPKNAMYEYANLYEGGNACDDPRKTSRTGYFNYKFIPLGANIDDKDYGYGKATHFHLAWLRLAEVYLLYAEAAAQGYGSASGKAPTFAKNAIEAVNVIRERAGVDGVAEDYIRDLEKFMGEVRRERAVELAFEGHRFNDLRRWKLLTEYPYNIKTMQKFDRAEEFDPEADPKERKVVNFREEIVTQRELSGKHYWLPFKTDDVTMYPEFYQNPGW